MVEHTPVQFLKRQLFWQGTIASKCQGKSWTLLLWHKLMHWGHLLLTDHPLLMDRRTSDHALKWSSSSKVCKCGKKGFLFVHAISRTHFKNLCDSVGNHGFIDGVHVSARKRPHNAFSYSNIENASCFMVNTTDTHGLPLPGRLPTCEQKVVALPSDMARPRFTKTIKSFVFSNN